MKTVINSIANIFALNYRLDPVSHLTDEGMTKSMQEYRHEVKQAARGIYCEHGVLLKNAHDGLFVRAFSNFGKILSGNISDLNILSREIFPISHYNAKGNLKTQKEFREDLKDHFATVYSRHEDMIEYENSTDIELVFNRGSKSVMSLINLELIDAVLNGMAAISYAAVGMTKAGYIITCSVADAAYGIYAHIMHNVKNSSASFQPDYLLNHDDAYLASIGLLGLSEISYDSHI